MSEDNKPNDDLRLSESEWKIKRQGELRNQEFDKLIQKVIDLESDNRKLRDKATPEGSVVLTKADAERWSQYVKFGKPDEIASLLDTAQGVQEELKTLKRKGKMREIADTYNLKSTVFEKLGSNLEFDVRDVDVEGNVKRTAFVMVNDQEIPLEQYIESEWKDFAPSLFTQQKQEQAPEQKSVTRPTFPAQKPVGETPSVSFDYIKQRKLESGDYNP